MFMGICAFKCVCCVLYAVLCTSLYYVQTFYSWIIRHAFTSIYGVTTYETVALKSTCAHMPRISINHKYNSELEKTKQVWISIWALPGD